MTAASIQDAFEPISLGLACETKYQLSRVMVFRKTPFLTQSAFRQMINPLGTSDGIKRFERHIFDWQVTPFASILAYLQMDFQGVFERADLIVSSSDEPETVHRTLDTAHPHDFHPRDGVLDAAAIDAGYAEARSKFDYLAQKFRDHLRAPGPFLYVHKTLPSRAGAEMLVRLLGAHSPDHRFHVLFVGQESEAHDLDDLEQVSVATLPAAIDKPPGHTWEGDDKAWDAVMAPFNLRMPHAHPDEILTVNGAIRAPRPSPEPEPVPKSGGLFGRLSAKFRG